MKVWKRLRFPQRNLQVAFSKETALQMVKQAAVILFALGMVGQVSTPAGLADAPQRAAASDWESTMTDKTTRRFRLARARTSPSTAPTSSKADRATM